MCVWGGRQGERRGKGEGGGGGEGRQCGSATLFYHTLPHVPSHNKHQAKPCTRCIYAHRATGWRFCTAEAQLIVVWDPAYLLPVTRAPVLLSKVTIVCCL